MAHSEKREAKAPGGGHGGAAGRAAAAVESAWDRYLRGLAAPQGALAPEAARRVQELWRTIQRAEGSVPPPFAAATEGGGLSMTWDRGRHHLELEVLADGTCDWFYMDRDSAERAGEDAAPLGTCTPGLVSYLRRTLGTAWKS